MRIARLMITHQQTQPCTHTSLCLSARYALTPRRAVTRVPSSIDIEQAYQEQVYTLGKLDNLVGAIYYFWQHGTRPPLPPHGPLPSPPTVYRHHGRQSLLL